MKRQFVFDLWLFVCLLFIFIVAFMIARNALGLGAPLYHAILWAVAVTVVPVAGMVLLLRLGRNHMLRSEAKRAEAELQKARKD